MKTPDEIMAEYAEKQTQRQHNILRKKGATKSNKKQLLKMQHEQCALCKENIPPSDQFCYDKVSGTVVDRKCMTYLSFWRELRAKGITEQATVEFNQQNSL